MTKFLFPFFLFISITCFGQVTMDKLIGINARGSDPVSRLKKFDHVRDYHQWNDDVGDSNDTLSRCPADFNAHDAQYLRYRLNQSFSGAALIFYDDFYQGLYRKAIPVMKGLAPQMRGYTHYPNEPKLLDQKPFCLTGAFDNDSLPPATVARPSLAAQSTPVTYRAHALRMTLFTARYGLTNYPLGSAYQSNFLFPHYVTQGSSPNLVERFPRRTGLRFVAYIENANEPEKSWYDEPAAIEEGLGNPWWQMTATQYAALLSADYDGHGRSADFAIPGTGQYLGVINADPAMRMVAGGTADFRGKYFADVVAWCRTNRQSSHFGFNTGPVLPFDVINFHHYSTTFSSEDLGGGNLPSFTTRYEDIKKAPILGPAITPEADNLKNEIVQLKSNLISTTPEVSNLEWWLTEFGYDSDGPYSQVVVPPVPGQGKQKTQAQWLVRSLLEIHATGIMSKATLYELRDDPGLYGQSYGYSGLLREDFSPKPAWYYVQTLKNVLTGYKHITPGTGGPRTGEVVELISADPQKEQLHVYRYNKPGLVAPTYVIWRPTQDGGSYNYDLTFELTGQTTASIIEMEEMDENGRRTAWTDLEFLASNRIKVKELPVSETPLFLVFGPGATNNPVLPVQALAASALCCDAVELTWTRQGVYSKYLVYYARQDLVPAASPFDYTNPNVHLYTDNLTGGATSVVIPGLLPGPTTSIYRFWVIPVDAYGTLPANWASQPVSASDTLSSCTAVTQTTACLLDITESMVTYPAAGNLGQVKDLLSIDKQENLCADLKAPLVSTEWNDWDYGTNNPLDRAIVITFPQPYTILVWHLLDSYGKGQMRFEYQDCSCPQWRVLTTIKLPVGYDTWASLANITNNLAITKLRITKLDPDAKLRKLLLCARPATCAPPERPQFNPGPITDLQAEPSDYSATLRWTAAAYNQDLPELGQIPEYYVRYSKLDDTNNELEIRLPLGPQESETSVELQDLEPATKYYAEVALEPKVDPPSHSLCGPSTPLPSASLIFVTNGVVAREAGGQEKPLLAGYFRVYPNPTDGRAWIELPREGYRQLSVIHLASGRAVHTQWLNPYSRQAQVELDGFRNGVYLLRATGDGLPALVSRIVVAK